MLLLLNTVTKCRWYEILTKVYGWYPQLVRGRFVYDTYMTMEATVSRHGWVHMFITHRPTVTLQLHNFESFRTYRTSSFCIVAWQLARFHLTRRIARPSAIAELRVDMCERTDRQTDRHSHRNRQYSARGRRQGWKRPNRSVNVSRGTGIRLRATRWRTAADAF